MFKAIKSTGARGIVWIYFQKHIPKTGGFPGFPGYLAYNIFDMIEYALLKSIQYNIRFEEQ